MVDAILRAGVVWVLWLQQFSPALDGLMVALTLPGEVVFYLALFPLLYWCVDRRLAARLTLLCILSLNLNAWAKEIVAQPRPYQYDPRVKPLREAAGGGLPSGHTQNTVAVWGYLAAWARRPWITALFVALLVLVPLSRLYLGAHFPSDLVGGYLLGALLLWLAWRAEAPAARAWGRLPLGVRLALAATLPPLILLAMPPLHERILDGALLLAGAGAGVVLAERWVPEARGGALWRRGLRLLVGLLTTLAFYLALEALARVVGWSGLAGAALYAPLGLWGALGAPWLFGRLGLTGGAPCS
jgi:membrane-associated phospholipid phosphatase